MIPRRLMGVGGNGVPTRSLDFEASSSQSLSMLSSDFGAFDNKKFGFCVSINQESASTMITDFGMSEAGAEGQFQVSLNTSGTNVVLSAKLGTGGVYTTYSISTDTSPISVGSYAHIYAYVDTTQGTSSNRMKLYIDGSIPSIISAGYPSLNNIMPPASVGQHVRIGPGVSSGTFDGLMYQICFFSGTLPTIDQLYSNGRPLDVRGLPGLYSLLQTTSSSTLEDDYVLSTNWTNNGTITKSTIVP